VQDRPTDPARPPGWYPDPGAQHDHRYHNGTSWTADVSNDGVRSVQSLSIVTSGADQKSGNVPLILGIVAMSTGWIPFLCFVAAVIAIFAVILGLRRRSDPTSSGAATAGVITGTVGVALAAAGIWMTVAILSSVSQFEQPGPNDTVITSCGEVGDVTRASGTVTNLDTSERSYTITVAFDDERTASVAVDDVAPGASAAFSVDENLRFEDLECRIDAVNGPRPFGFGDND
jgi:succinate dehydrogenase hydrophobic anchor subunit